MKGAEFYMFYVDDNGTAQYTNRYGIGNTKPAVSDHEDFVAVNTSFFFIFCIHNIISFFFFDYKGNAKCDLCWY